jgi:glucose-1-phosphatase
MPLHDKEVQPLPTRVLLFDLGGVLIDIDFERVFEAWARHSTLRLHEIRQRFMDDTAYERHERGEMDGASYLSHLGGLLEIHAPEQAVRDGWNSVFVGEISDTVALVRAARRGLPCFAFTNTNRIHQQAWSAAYPAVVSLFDEIFVSSELGLRKPERRSFAAVAQRIGVQPAEILFFDDMRQNVEGARSLGMRAVQVTEPEDVRRALDEILPS